ncbi:hypothetical protein ACFPRL_29100 [Pseudoclavibacter helvolus]
MTRHRDGRGPPTVEVSLVSSWNVNLDREPISRGRLFLAAHDLPPRGNPRVS